MEKNSEPTPSVMPLDREAWAKQLNLSNFINSYYQYRDLQLCAGKRLLVVGPGQGLDVEVFRWRGYHVTTFDIDETFRPDFLGSVHEMKMFSNNQFDVVIASHVLEHLPVSYLEAALAELARVANYAIIYLPVAGRHGQLRFSLGARDIAFSFCWDIFNFFAKPDGKTLRYCQKQHYWEVGRRGFRVTDLRRRFEHHFHVLTLYRNQDWKHSYNFVLQKKVAR
jgi:SAM-dependent methyltransferase